MPIGNLGEARTGAPAMTRAADLTDTEAQILCAEVLGWTCINREYMVGLVPHRSVNDYTAKQVMEGEVPLEYLPPFSTDPTSCQALIDYMCQHGWRLYIEVDPDGNCSAHFYKPYTAPVLPVPHKTLARAIVNAFLAANGRATA